MKVVLSMLSEFESHDQIDREKEREMQERAYSNLAPLNTKFTLSLPFSLTSMHQRTELYGFTFLGKLLCQPLSIFILIFIFGKKNFFHFEGMLTADL